MNSNEIFSAESNERGPWVVFELNPKGEVRLWLDNGGEMFRPTYAHHEKAGFTKDSPLGGIDLVRAEDADAPSV